MTKYDIVNLIREIVKKYPLINTFTVVDGPGDFEPSNTTKNYNDYLNGHFWSRDWELQGADAGALRKQYPILGLEQKRVTKKSIYDKTSCYEFWILIADQVGCETCETKYSIEQVDQRLQDIAVIFLEALVKYGYDDNGFQPSNPGLSCFRDNIFEDGPLDIKAVSLGLADKVRGVSFSLTFCNCMEPYDMDREFNPPENIALTKCSTC